MSQTQKDLISSLRFCNKCGSNTVRDSPSDSCPHSYKPPLEFLRPCKTLYGADTSWVLYTIDDDQKTVFVDSPDYSAKQRVGTGGIVLRDPQLILKKWPITDKENINLLLKSQFHIEDQSRINKIEEILEMLDLLAKTASEAWPYNEIFFREEDDCPGLRFGKLPIDPIIDQFGDIKMSEILDELVLHGQWDAKYRI